MTGKIQEQLSVFWEHINQTWLGSLIGALAWVVIYQFTFLYNNRKYIESTLPEVLKNEQLDSPKSDEGDVIDVELVEGVYEAEWYITPGTFKVGTITSGTYLTKNFQFKEFRSKDGVMPTQEELDNIAEMAAIMQIVRDYFNSGKVQLELHIVNAVHLNSAHRSKQRNEQTDGSAVGSYHIPGLAVDFRVDRYTPHQVYIVMEHLIDTGQIPKGGLSRYSTHVHYDSRGFNARW